MKKILTSTLLICISFTGYAKTINFGLNATYAPFEFYNDKNELSGFDIDIGNKICEKLNYTCKFTDQLFDSLIPSLKAKRIDATISGIDITADRLKQVDFSQSYFQNSAKFMISKNKYKSVDNITNKKIGVQNGTTHQKYILEKFPKAQVVTYDSYQYAVIDLKAQRIDAIFCDTAVAQEWLEKETNLESIGKDIVDSTYFGQGLGIAVRKGNKSLLKDLNKALDIMKKDGSYDAIFAKWFNYKK